MTDVLCLFLGIEMNDINDWKRYYGEERVKRAELEVATDELVEAAEMVLACIDQPRSRDNSEHAGIDAAEALRKATAEVKEFNSATLKYVHGLAAGDLPMVGDLAMLVARLARKLRKAAPADELPVQALDYLNRNGLKGSPLRDARIAELAETRKDAERQVPDGMVLVGTVIKPSGGIDYIRWNVVYESIPAGTKLYAQIAAAKEEG